MRFEKMWLLVHHHPLVHLGCLYHSFPNKRPLYIVGTLHTLPPYTSLCLEEVTLLENNGLACLILNAVNFDTAWLWSAQAK